MNKKHLVAAAAVVVMAVGVTAIGADRKILGEYFTQPG